MNRRRGRGPAYVGVGLGLAMSVAANVAHSYVPPIGAPAGWSPNVGAVVGAFFWPLAVVLALEILTRTEWLPGWRWVAARYLGLLPVALVAAVVSYRHMSGLLTFYGEEPLTCIIGPLAVDGLMVMATSALLATSKQDIANAVIGAPAKLKSPSVRPRSRATVSDQVLLKVSREIVRTLDAEGLTVSRRALTQRLRARGHAVSNARAGDLLRLVGQQT